MNPASRKRDKICGQFASKVQASSRLLSAGLEEPYEGSYVYDMLAQK